MDSVGGLIPILVLAERFVDSQVVGIDLSEPLLRLAREAAQAAHLGERVRFESADVQQMPREDDSFDAVLELPRCRPRN